MTILYSSKIATNSPLAFLKLLLRWKGSAYYYIWCEFVIFIGIYSLISISYRFIMPDDMRRAFEGFCLVCSTMGEQIPLGFVMGFFVDLIVGRWWDQFVTIPWPDELVMLLAAHTNGNSKRLKHQLRTFMRYINLSFCLATRGISSRLRRRFSTEQQLLASALITREELKVLQESAPFSKPAYYTIPLFWAADLLTQMRYEGSIIGDQAVATINSELLDFRIGLEKLIMFDWINTPLAYTQVATVTVHSYFISSLFAWQFLDTDQHYANHSIDMYVPVFGMLRFLFYMGWLKVAESLINPFGEDPDDFELEEIFDRDMQFCHFMLEDMRDEAPPLARGILLETQEPIFPKNSVDTRRVSMQSEMLFLGSLHNTNSTTEVRRRSIFSSRQSGLNTCGERTG